MVGTLSLVSVTFGTAQQGGDWVECPITQTHPRPL